MAIPAWAGQLISLYESGAASQFVLYGNIYDRFVLPLSSSTELGNLRDYLLRVLLPKFDVVLSYDLATASASKKGARASVNGPRFATRSSCPKLHARR